MEGEQGTTAVAEASRKPRKATLVKFVDEPTMLATELLSKYHRPYKVTAPDGRLFFATAIFPEKALAGFAEADGYKIDLVGGRTRKLKAVKADQVDVDSMSEEERKALLDRLMGKGGDVPGQQVIGAPGTGAAQANASNAGASGAQTSGGTGGSAKGDPDAGRDAGKGKDDKGKGKPAASHKGGGRK